MKHSSFDATISALDVETSAFGVVTSAIARRSFDVETSLHDAETLALDAEMSALGTATSAAPPTPFDAMILALNTAKGPTGARCNDIGARPKFPSILPTAMLV